MPHRLEGSRVMVTGGCGFIGSHLVRALLDRGARSVIVLDSLIHGNASRVEGLPGVELVRFNLGSDPENELLPCLDGVDFLFHLAALKHNQSRDEPLAVLRANVIGTCALLAAAVRQKVKKSVFSSSLYAYGRVHAPELSESETTQPRTVYGISKLAGEQLFAHFHQAYGIDQVVLRYFFVYGPNQNAGTGYPSVVVRNFERLRRREQPTVYGDGEQALDYVYIDDVVEATLLALEADCPGEIFNVGSGAPTTVNQLIDKMIAVAGRLVAKLYLPPDETAGTYRVARIDRIRARLGWSQRTPLDEGLARTYHVPGGGPAA